MRIVYIGSGIANLSHLVSTEQPERKTVHFPFPQIRPHLPWKPKHDDSTSVLLNDEVLRDVSSFPTREVRDDLVQSFFDLVHPGFPVIDEQDFRRHYDDPSDPPPLILFQAVLLAGAHVTVHPLVASSRLMVKTTLYRRTKTLFDMRYENDRLFLVQAALLLTWHQENSDNVSSNSWHWIGVACRIAYGLGVHRDLSATSQSLMPARDRQMYRRVWWTLFKVEAFAALEYGRPSMIRYEDFDQPELSEWDMTTETGYDDANIKLEVLKLNIDLAYLALELAKLYAPMATQSLSTSVEGMNEQLATLALRLPTTREFFACQTQLHYYTVLLHVNRHSQNVPLSMPRHGQFEKISSEAAISALACFETLCSNGTIRQCYTTASMALMAVLIQFMHEIKSAINDASMLLAVGANAKLGRLLVVARELSNYWPNAEAILKLCQGLHDRFSNVIQRHMSTTSPQQRQQSVDESGMFWQDLFSAYDNFDFGQDFGDDSWMNIGTTISN